MAAPPVARNLQAMKRSEQRREAAFALYQSEVGERELTQLLEGTKPFTRALAEGTVTHLADLDAEIDANAHSWSIDRIAPLEKAIMRIALYEIHHRDDVPTHVAISEAVSLASQYCGTETPRFVNGVLSAAAAAGPEQAASEEAAPRPSNEVEA